MHDHLRLLSFRQIVFRIIKGDAARLAVEGLELGGDECGGYFKVGRIILLVLVNDPYTHPTGEDRVFSYQEDQLGEGIIERTVLLDDPGSLVQVGQLFEL